MPESAAPGWSRPTRWTSAAAAATRPSGSAPSACTTGPDSRWSPGASRRGRSCACNWDNLSSDTVESGSARSTNGGTDQPNGETNMRFMVIVKATKDSEAGQMPSEELLAAMGKYNEELVKAGIMLAGEGLHPSSKGARVRFSGDKRTVIDGPFTETKELIAGYWLWQVES